MELLVLKLSIVFNFKVLWTMKLSNIRVQVCGTQKVPIPLSINATFLFFWNLWCYDLF